eukprot:3257144-Karenia_brevis.AAC.1
MLESSKSSETEKSKAWYVGAVQCGVPYERRRENRFEQLVEEGEEEEIEESIEIPSLVSSDDEEEEKQEIPSNQDLERMIKVVGKREQRRERQRKADIEFRERINSIHVCRKNCCMEPVEKKE